MQRFRRDGIYPSAADADFTAVCIIKAHQKVDNGTFSAARCPDNAQALSFFQPEGEIIQIIFLLLIGKGNMIKHNIRFFLPGTPVTEPQILRRLQHFNHPGCRSAAL